MKVILQKDIRGKGKKGQMIEVAEGYARNFLLPKKLAVIATAENLNTMKQQEKARKAQEAAEKAEADNAHAHDRAAGESDGEGAVHAVLKGGVRGADIGLGGDAHAEEASEDRAAGARNKAQRCGKINENGDQDKQDKNKNSQNLIF